MANIEINEIPFENGVNDDSYFVFDRYVSGEYVTNKSRWIDLKNDIDSDLEIDNTPIYLGVSGRILYENSDNRLSEVQGFNYDQVTDTLVFDNNNNVGFISGEIEILPSISIPISAIRGPDGFIGGYLDLNSIAGNQQGFFGYQNGSQINVIELGSVSLSSADNVNISADTNVNISADTNVNISADTNVNISADGNMLLECEFMNIQLNGAVDLQNYDLKININDNQLSIADTDLGYVRHTFNYSSGFSIGQDGGSSLGVIQGNSNEIGFFGTGQVTRRSVPLGSSTDDIIKALQEYGLFSET